MSWGSSFAAAWNAATETAKTVAHAAAQTAKSAYAFGLAGLKSLTSEIGQEIPLKPVSAVQSNKRSGTVEKAANSYHEGDKALNDSVVSVTQPCPKRNNVAVDTTTFNSQPTIGGDRAKSPMPKGRQSVAEVVEVARSRIDQRETTPGYCLGEVFRAIGTNTPNGLGVDLQNLPYHGDRNDGWDGHWAQDSGIELERVGYVKVGYDEYSALRDANGGKDIAGAIAVTPGTATVPPGHISISDGSGGWLDYSVHRTPNALKGTSPADSAYYLPF